MTSEFREKLLTIGYLGGGRTRDKVEETRHPTKGYRIKSTTDELNNTVTEHAIGDRQDVMMRPKTVRLEQ